jgi:hypothetical protein
VIPRRVGDGDDCGARASHDVRLDAPHAIVKTKWVSFCFSTFPCRHYIKTAYLRAGLIVIQGQYEKKPCPSFEGQGFNHFKHLPEGGGLSPGEIRTRTVGRSRQLRPGRSDQSRRSA